MARDETFLARWSRRKQEERLGETPKAKQEVASRPSQPNAPEPGGAPDENRELPSVESLTKDSDFSVFMKAGVPDALRNRALRKLWETDPSLYAHDGLTDYGADYAKIMRDGEKLAETAYKVGRGFLEKGELPWEKEEEEEKAKKAAALAEKAEALPKSETAPLDPAPKAADAELVKPEDKDPKSLG